MQLIGGFEVQSQRRSNRKGAEAAVRAFFLATFLLLYCGAAFGQAEKPALADGIDEAYLARDDGNGKAGEQVTEFRTTDVPIYCVVLLESHTSTVVKMNFVAVNVTGVKPDTKVVTASYTTKDGQNRVNFSGRPPAKWTPGKYRVDLFLDGKKAREVEFYIKNNGGAVGAGGSATAAKNLQSTEIPKPKQRKANPLK